MPIDIDEYVAMIKADDKVTFLINKNDWLIGSKNKTYYSIQLINTKQSWTAEKLASYYFSWLETRFFKLINVSKIENKLSIRFLNKPLLELTLHNQSEGCYQYFVTGGLLAKKTESASFTFYTTNSRAMISLDQFSPTLPWFIYRLTQAPIHEIVMWRFQKKLQER